MATLNGFGTMFYGWKHQPGEYSTATKWLAAFYIPLIPIGRYRLAVLTDFARETTKIRATPVGLIASQEDRFDVAGKTSLSWTEVLRTYLNAFIGLPALMFGPVAVLWLLSSMPWFPHYHSDAETPVWFTALLMGTIACALGNTLYWPIWAIRQSRGMQAGQSPGARRARATPVDRRSIEHHL